MLIENDVDLGCIRLVVIILQWKSNKIVTKPANPCESIYIYISSLTGLMKKVRNGKIILTG